MTEPKGKLIIIGGAVDIGSFSEKVFDKDVSKNINFFEKGILKRIILESRHGESSAMLIITTASTIPEVVGEEYVKAFAHLDARNTQMLNIASRDQANDKAVVNHLKNSDVVMFTGGDQLRLTSILGGTKFHEVLLQKYAEEEFIISGTSAGAAACSNNMIYQGSSHEALLKGEIKITGGLGLINDVIIDTHFVQRGRIGRLFQAVVSNPAILGIGLGEDTGLLILNGNNMEAIGSGLVILVDGRNIRDTNITEVGLGMPVSIENLVVHVMSINDRYNLKNHSLEINHIHKADVEHYAKIDR